MTAKGPRGSAGGTPVSVNDLKQKIDDIIAKKKKTKTLNKKDLENIAKDYTMDDLIAFQKSALHDTVMTKDEKIAILGDIVDLVETKKGIDTNLSEKEKKEQDKAHKKEIKNWMSTTEENKKNQEAEAKELRNKLLGEQTKVENLEGKVADKDKELTEKDAELSEKDKSILEKEQEIEKLDKENSDKLKELLAEKQKGILDADTIKKLKDDIRDIESKRKRLETFINATNGPAPVYDNIEITKLKTRWIGGKFWVNNVGIDGRNHFSIFELNFVKKLRTRSRLNKTVKKFNKIGDNPKKGLQYFLAKNSFIKGGKIGMGIKRIKNYFSIRDHGKLDEIFEKQKKKFISDLEDKMNPADGSEDRKTIDAIKKRLEYYHAAYKRDFITL